MIKPLKSNPGGQLAPSDVIGRDKLISHLLDALEKHGVVLTAERRMGKTTILRKIQAEAPSQSCIEGKSSFHWILQKTSILWTTSS